MRIVLQRVANAVTAERLASREAIAALALETVEVVAKRLHPERQDPLLQFTLPDALAVIHAASGSLRDVVLTSVPLGDRITLSHLMRLYRWRGAVQFAETGFDLWRIVRLFNPVTAATQEVREKYSRQLFDIGREQLSRRLGGALVQEVGRAAIDLYGGAAAIPRETIAGHVTTQSSGPAKVASEEGKEPLRILVAGQVGAGKSSLVNALTQSVAAPTHALPTTTTFETYRIEKEGLPPALIIDSPGLTAASGASAAFLDMAYSSDVIIWVASALQGARAVDAAALEAVRAHFREQPKRRPPPVLLALTHIDGLRPFSDWKPPYDLGNPQTEKGKSIHAARAAVAMELGFGEDDVVPVRIDPGESYAIDALWRRVLALLPNARAARLLRVIEDIKGKSTWRSVFGQAANAGRMLARVLRRDKADKT